MRVDMDEKYKTVDCPYCRVQSGDSCRSPQTGGTFGRLVHRERVRAWEKARDGV